MTPCVFRRPALLTAMALLLALLAGTTHAQDPNENVPLLTPGEAKAIVFPPGGPYRVHFRVQVADDVTTMRIELAQTGIDLDLYARHGQPVQKAGDDDARSATMRLRESIVLRRGGRPDLKTGMWFITVDDADMRPGRGELKVVLETGSGSTPGPTAGGIAVLKADTPAAFQLPDGDKDFVQFEFMVPADAKSVKFAIDSPGQVDLDLFVRQTEAFGNTLGTATWRSNRDTKNEAISITTSGQPALQPGTRIFVAVHDYPRQPVAGTLTATVNEEFRSVTALTAGTPMVVHFDGVGAQEQRFSIEVPDDVKSIQVDLEVGTIDVDLFMRHGEMMLQKEQATIASQNEGQNESIMLRREYPGARELSTGTWHILVWNYENKPTDVTLVVHFDVPPPGGLPQAADVDLVPGTPLDFTLPQNGRGYIIGKVTVPETVGSMTVSIDSTGEGADLDLFVAQGKLPERLGDITLSSRTEGSAEVVFLNAAELVAGDYFVIAQSYQNKPASGKMLVEFDKDAPVLGQVDGELEPNVPRAIPFPHPDPKRAFYTLVFLIPDTAKSMLIKVEGAEADVDLYVRHQKQIQSWNAEGCDFIGGTPEANEVLWVNRALGLKSGLYYMDVRSYGTGASAANTKITLLLNAEKPPDYKAPEGSAEPVPLPLDTPTDIILDRRRDKLSRFVVQVPEGSAALFIQVSGSDADLDIYARFGRVVGNTDDASAFDASATSGLCDELLEIRGAENAPVRAGTWYVDVIAFRLDLEVTFTVLATVGETAPPMPSLMVPPYRPLAGLNAMQRAVDASVRIECAKGSGAGTVLTPDGLILTCMHVVGDNDAGTYQATDIIVAFTWDERESPRQTHYAKVLKVDAELDLALLQVERTVRKEPFDPGVTPLTWLPIGDSTALRIGDTIDVFGFPAIGGQASRPGVTLTRGMVSGFQSKRRKTWWIKTDADISPGNSGGTVTNSKGELVGVPSIVIHRDDAILAFCRPTERIPDEWLTLIKEHLPR
ncbi:MAG: trypsin-like peptidase domain-containing protein [Planctomycetota bacterium]